MRAPTPFRTFASAPVDVPPVDGVWQCDRCDGFTNATGMPLPRPDVPLAALIDLPKLVCGECAAGGRRGASGDGREPDVRSQKPARRTEPACAGLPRRGNSTSRPTSIGIERGCPPEREFEDKAESRKLKSENNGERLVGSSQRDFEAVVNVAPAHKKLLDVFQGRYGEWIPLPELEAICGHHAVNSRCSELRQLIPTDHDIDQQNRLYEPTGKLHSHYRLCLKSVSDRLKRREESGEKLL